MFKVEGPVEEDALVVALDTAGLTYELQVNVALTYRDHSEWRYEMHCLLYRECPNCFAKPYGYIPSYSPSTITGNIHSNFTERISCEVFEQGEALPVIQDVTDFELGNRVEELKLVSSNVINIIRHALDRRAVLMDVRLEYIKKYKDVYKLCFLPEVRYIGEKLFTRNFLEACAKDGTCVAPELAKMVRTPSYYCSTIVVTAEMGMWELGILLFHLFSGATFRSALGYQELVGLTTSHCLHCLSTLTQKTVDGIIIRMITGPMCWLFRDIVSMVLRVDPRERSLLGYQNVADHRNELIYFIEKSASIDAVYQLLEESPQLVGTVYDKGKLPIMRALEVRSTPALIKLLLQTDSNTVNVRFPDGISCLQYAIDHDIGEEYVKVLIPYFMPVDKNTGEPSSFDHDHGWHRIISVTNPPDKYIGVVRDILEEYAMHSEALGNAKDNMGRTATHIATPLCREAILSQMRFMGQYEFVSGAVEHESETCIVRFAVDMTSNLSVAMKFIREKSQLVQEVSSRQSKCLSADYVIEVISALRCDADPKFARELSRKRYSQYFGCIVMPRADRTLEAIIAHEHVAGKDWGAIRLLFRQILSAVEHLHERGVVHGDLKRKYSYEHPYPYPCFALLLSSLTHVL